MANITVKRDQGGLVPVPARGGSEWDPMRLARELFRFDPFAEMIPYRASEALNFAPNFEVKETKDGYVFKADVPGVKEEDIEITRMGNRLIVGGKREADKEEKGDTYYAYERTYGSFSRTFTLPEGIDEEHIRAELKEGVLTLVAPKKPEAQPRKISLKGLFERKSS